MKEHTQSMTLGGKTLTFSVGRLAMQATASVLATWGETTVLAVVTVGREKPDLDYFPLSVEYVEKLYAGGIIKGSRWVKREGKPTDEAVLRGRLIDRSIRPLFPKSYRKEVQAVAHLLSVDAETSPDILAAIAVSAAVHISPVPWNGPTATSRIGYIGNQLIAHPTDTQMDTSLLDLVVTTVHGRVNMIETKASIIQEHVIEEGIRLASDENAKIIEFINQLRQAVGQGKEVAQESAFDETLLALLKTEFANDLEAMIKTKASKENDDPASLEKFAQVVCERYPEAYGVAQIVQTADYLVKTMIREKMLTTRTRIDGRGFDEIRNLTAQVSVIPRIHGSGLFERGDTQVLSIATLATPSLEQLLEGPTGQESKRYIHHYNFPPYSVGEVGRIGFTNRREIGHGALAEKALEPVLPPENEFPYTIRVVSEVLGSNGSTSMASVCGSTLALYDAGVPLKAPVAGIAMGLVSQSDDDYIVLTDIMGVEDFSGEMDFKVAGTPDGITAIQLDVKTLGLTDGMIHEILQKARSARLKILQIMLNAIPAARPSVSQYAPKIVVVPIPEDKIGEVIGPGGKTIRSLISKFEVGIDIEDDGRAIVSGVDKSKVDACAKHIADMTRELLPGERFTGTVVRVENYGVFVELFPGKTGLVHVSRLADGYVHDANDLVKVGDQMEVEVYEIDEMGRINIKPVMPYSTPENISSGTGYDDRPLRREYGDGNQNSRRRDYRGRGGGSRGGFSRKPPLRRGGGNGGFFGGGNRR
jgi:polyribonucleotide nucleotidyltransferase